MQKIKDNEFKDIKGGAASGALLNGIRSIVGKVGDFVIDVGMLPFAYIEAAKVMLKPSLRLKDLVSSLMIRLLLS